MLGLFLYGGVCRQCRGDHLRTVGSTDPDSEVQDPGLVSTSHPEPQIHEPSCSAESAEEILEPLQLLPPATEESEQLSAAPALHIRFQDLISEVSSSAVCEWVYWFQRGGTFASLAL